jgi:hypothetical protein
MKKVKEKMGSLAALAEVRARALALAFDDHEHNRRKCMEWRLEPVG